MILSTHKLNLTTFSNAILNYISVSQDGYKQVKTIKLISKNHTISIIFNIAMAHICT